MNPVVIYIKICNNTRGSWGVGVFSRRVFPLSTSHTSCPGVVVGGAAWPQIFKNFDFLQRERERVEILF